MRTKFFMLVVLAPILILLCSAQAAEPDQPATFATEFVDAIRSKNVERLQALLHPKTRSCIDDQSQQYFNWIFSRQLKYNIPDGYKVTVTPIPAGEALFSLGNSEYPVRPTHQVQIDFEPGPNRGVTIVLQIVHDDSRWYEVLPCPSPEAIAQFQAAEAQRKEQQQRARSLADRLSDPLRGEIVALAKEGRRVEAIKRLAEVSGEDLSIASYAVDILVPRE